MATRLTTKMEWPPTILSSVNLGINALAVVSDRMWLVACSVLLWSGAVALMKREGLRTSTYVMIGLLPSLVKAAYLAATMNKSYYSFSALTLCAFIAIIMGYAVLLLSKEGVRLWFVVLIGLSNLV